MGFAMGLWVFLQWFTVDLWWIAVVGLYLQWFLLFFFFSFYVAPNIVKYFRDYFPKCKQTLKKQSFSLKSFLFTNILLWRMFYVETNGALVTNGVRCDESGVRLLG